MNLKMLTNISIIFTVEMIQFAMTRDSGDQMSSEK